MKKIFLLILLLPLAICTVVAQETPPSPYTDVKVSYLRVWESTAPESNPNTLITRLLKDVKQSTQYYDGLGRAFQTVTRQGSFETGNTPVDMVEATTYDAYDRERLKYQKFPANNTGGNTQISNGAFKTNPFQQQETFMQAEFGGQGETYFYSEIKYESSPLSRVDKVMSAGNSWVGSNRGNELKYLTNTPDDVVRIWTVSNNAGTFGSYTTSATYPAGELLKNVTFDEHGRQSIEFKTKDNKLILKKIQWTAATDNGAGANHDGWICTYFIYDDLNHLRCVIQPEGVKAIDGPWSLSGPLMSEQCFRYEYDEKNRRIMTKKPGAAEEYTIYDRWDRVILSQDGNLRAGNNWLFIKYDWQNRPIMTGIHNDAVNVGITAMINHVSTTAGSLGRFENLDPSKPHGYTTLLTYPSVASPDVYTVTWYDNYGWASSLSSNLKDFNTSYASTYLQTPSTNTWPYPQAVTQSMQTHGMMTGTRTRVLGTSTFLTTVAFFDEKGRMIQTRVENISGGIDVLTTQYTWAGQPLVLVVKSDKFAPNAQTNIVVTQVTYDDIGRLIKMEKKVSNTLLNSGAMPAFNTLFDNEYDKLGRIKNKKLAPGYNINAGLETLTNEYNIREWLLGTNRSYLKENNAGDYTNRYFGFELAYDKTSSVAGSATYADAEYNGNIAGTTWKSRGDQVRRRYDFAYDEVNRIGKAGFSQNSSETGGSWNWTDANFSINGFDADNGYKLKYDYNGNLKSMVQHGVKGLNPDAYVDALRYYYLPNNSNKLEKVIDEWTDANTRLGDFKDGSNGNGTDYDYDANGNMKQDLNKGISNITYNHLDLPVVITVPGKGTIMYTYDAGGNKLKKEVVETGQPNKTTLYMGGAVYENDDLQYISHEEGRIRFVKATTSTCPPLGDRFVYDYFVKDHLGNVRMVLTDQKEDVCYIPATVEDTRYVNEGAVYDIVNGRRIDKTTAGAGSVSSFESKVYRTHGGQTNEKTGLGAIFKVMSGDKIKIFAESFYTIPGGGIGSPLPLGLSELLASLVNNGHVVNGIHGTVSTSQVENAWNNANQFSGFLSSNVEGSNNARAFVNWILLDEQLRFVDGDADPVQPGGGYKLHDYFVNNPVNITKNGYLYVYVSNESNLPVYFDNLAVTHTNGPILEETHYYPFGLTMAAISSKSINKQLNKKNYQGYEYNNDLGININESFYRSHDPQTGRFMQIDPKLGFIESPYAAMGNNPLRYSDPLGDIIVDKNGKEVTISWDAQGNLVFTFDASYSRDEEKKVRKDFMKTQNPTLKSLNSSEAGKKLIRQMITHSTKININDMVFFRGTMGGERNSNIYPENYDKETGYYEKAKITPYFNMYKQEKKVFEGSFDEWLLAVMTVEIGHIEKDQIAKELEVEKTDPNYAKKKDSDGFKTVYTPLFNAATSARVAYREEKGLSITPRTFSLLDDFKFKYTPENQKKRDEIEPPVHELQHSSPPAKKPF